VLTRRWLRSCLFAVPTAILAAVGVPAVERRIRQLRTSWDARVAIEGRSMEPALEPGDWLLVDPDAFAQRPPASGSLILAPDPRQPELLLLKRVGSVDVNGSLHVLGDAPDASTDSRTFGSIDPATVLGRPWFRYWPLRRAGRVR
jgi:nickel-type superoxide dismutase maturation protease